MVKYFKYPFAEMGDKTEIKDDVQTDGTISYQAGWTFDYERKYGSDPQAKPVARDRTNQLNYDITSVLKQYQENGFFDYITPEMNGGSAFPYALAACVRFDISEQQDGSDIRIFSSRIADNTTTPLEAPDNWRELNKMSGTVIYGFSTIDSDTSLSIDQAGVVLIDASGGDITVTLPSVEDNVGYNLKRIDNSTNQVKVVTSGLDKIRYNLDVNSNGYSLFYLMGAGDFWEIAADGTGNWWPLNRKDNNPIGRTFFDTSIITPIGGYLLANGTELLRTDYPFLWDYAQKSGLLVDDSERGGFEGCWTKGDGAATFRIPDLRGEFLRALDNGRGIDITTEIIEEVETTNERQAGSWQVDEFKSHVHPNQQTINSIVAYPGSIAAGSVEGFTGETGGSETRPRNIAYPLYIKII